MSSCGEWCGPAVGRWQVRGAAAGRLRARTCVRQARPGLPHANTVRLRGPGPPAGLWGPGEWCTPPSGSRWAAVAAHVDRRVGHEDVGTAVIGGDKAEALVRVEPRFLAPSAVSFKDEPGSARSRGPAAGCPPPEARLHSQTARRPLPKMRAPSRLQTPTTTACYSAVRWPAYSRRARPVSEAPRVPGAQRESAARTPSSAGGLPVGDGLAAVAALAGCAGFRSSASRRRRVQGRQVLLR